MPHVQVTGRDIHHAYIPFATVPTRSWLRLPAESKAIYARMAQHVNQSADALHSGKALYCAVCADFPYPAQRWEQLSASVHEMYIKIARSLLLRFS